MGDSKLGTYATGGVGEGTVATLVPISMLNIMGGAAVAPAPPAPPAMTQAFPEAGEATASLVITLPSLTVALSGFFVGMLADRIGKAPKRRGR